MIVAGTAALAAYALPPAATAAQLPNATLQSTSQVITWSGANAVPDPTGDGLAPPLEQTCTTTTCDSFLLKVAMPPGSFPKAPLSPTPPGITRLYSEGPTDTPGDGVLITVHWATDFDQWNLFVDDLSTGQTVAQGLNVDSNAQSVLLSRPHNGVYRVTIVPFYTGFQKGDNTYRGEARAFLDPTQRYPTTTQLLPRIETMAPSNFHIGDVPPIPSNPTGWRFTPDGTFSNSCYLDETIQNGSTRCLRFDNNIRNVGTGPLLLRFNYSPDAFIGNCHMQQEIISSNATVTDRDAGPCVFHPQHAHFHYQNMGVYQLFSVDANGQPGAQPVSTSRKVGFCTVDVDDYGFGGPASLQRPRTYSFPTCNIANAFSTTPLQLSPFVGTNVPEFMGVSPGWGDVYTWDLPSQYIDVSNIRDGVYAVVSRSNPDGALLTSDRSRETGVTCIQITGNKVTTLAQLPSQSNAAPLPNCRASGSGNFGAGAGTAGARKRCKRSLRQRRHHRKLKHCRKGKRAKRRHAPRNRKR
jgi:hypothetical protein